MARECVDVERGVVYGVVAGEPLVLDVYRSLPRGEPQPAVVLIHDGGMWTGSRADMEHPAQQLARAGYVACSVDYRLVDAAAGCHRWPAQLDDVQRAVRWVRAHAADYGIDPMRVGAYGWSAGGQLAALLGTRDTRDATAPLASYPSRVACVVDLAGDVDLSAYTQLPALHEVVALLGGTPQEVPERYRDASPLSWIDGRTAPFLVVHGAQDDVVPIEQSRRLVAALRTAGVEVPTWSWLAPATTTWRGPGSARRCLPSAICVPGPEGTGENSCASTGIDETAVETGPSRVQSSSTTGQ